MRSTKTPKTAPKPVKPKRPEVRSLTIQPKIRYNVYDEKQAPEIKLSGEWLRNLGFEFGDKVKITTMQQLLIITPFE